LLKIPNVTPPDVGYFQDERGKDTGRINRGART
jgi:hypothetical protein